MLNKSVLALVLVMSVGAPMSTMVQAGETCGNYCDGGGQAVPEMDAGVAALGLGLTIGLVAFLRERNRRNK